MAQKPILGELMYEIDSLYVSTEMILSLRFKRPPLDGLLLEACLLHFRVVWDFFYRRKKKRTDVAVTDFVPKWVGIAPPARLKEIRKRLNVMLAHLTTHRLRPDYQAGETVEDISQIRKHTETLVAAFVKALTKEQRDELVNPLARKFVGYETLSH